MTMIHLALNNNPRKGIFYDLVQLSVHKFILINFNQTTQPTSASIDFENFTTGNETPPTNPLEISTNPHIY